MNSSLRVILASLSLLVAVAFVVAAAVVVAAAFAVAVAVAVAVASAVALASVAAAAAVAAVVLVERFAIAVRVAGFAQEGVAEPAEPVAIRDFSAAQIAGYLVAFPGQPDWASASVAVVPESWSGVRRESHFPVALDRPACFPAGCDLQRVARRSVPRADLTEDCP